jgi:hypothetical protein
VKPVPHTSLLPFAQAAPAGDTATTTEFLRQILPGESSREDKKNASQSRAIRDAGTTAFGFGKFRWQQRCDDFPERVADQRFGHVLPTLSSIKPARCPVL